MRCASGLFAVLFAVSGSDVLAAASGEATVRVALHSARAEATVASAAPVRVTAPGSRQTMPGILNVRRDGARVAVNGVRMTSPVRVEPTSSLLALDGTPLRGAVVLLARETGLLIVNELPLDAYLKGVVPAEVPAAWPSEALKAQAIVARTYVLYHKAERAGREFDVDATVQSQVYGGMGSEDPRTSAAVEATAGRVVTHEGRLALTPYHSTSAGPTEDAAEVWNVDLPYLKGVECPFDAESPAVRWERRLPVEEIESALRDAAYRIGPIATLTPLGRNRSGRVTAVRILHGEGELILKGESLRRIIGYQRVPSMRFDVIEFDVDPATRRLAVRLDGGGWGHGVGLCQWGMKALAERGWSAERILDYYYPGTNVDVSTPRVLRAR
ncbi:MAG: SpoIID/LytB domain-containing protein [Nitrospiria bacterium]